MTALKPSQKKQLIKEANVLLDRAEILVARMVANASAAR